jgi:hypothetical protein
LPTVFRFSSKNSTVSPFLVFKSFNCYTVLSNSL